MSSSRIHCCYIMFSTAFKEEHTLEQDELFCCVIIRCGLKGKKIVTKWKECRRKKKACLFLLLKSPRPFLLLRDPRLLINLPEN